MAPWRVGPSLALAAVLAAAVAPASRWSGDKANEMRRGDAAARPHTIQIIKGAAPRPRPPGGVVHLDVAPAGGVVTVSGCGMHEVPFEPETRMDLHIEALPCRLVPTVTAGALSVPGTPLEIRDFGGHARLEVPPWTPGGVGITFGSDRTVSLLLPDAPADRAGLREGDRIVAVDGRSLHGLSSDETPPYIIGPVGEPVTLTIWRGDAAFDVTVERALIPVWPGDRASRFPR